MLRAIIVHLTVKGVVLNMEVNNELTIRVLYVLVY